MRGEAIIIEVDGSIRTVPLDHPPRAKEIHEWVKGYIEVVPCFTSYRGERCVAFCNEEGKLDGMQINVVATALWLNSGHQHHEPNDVLVGPVAIIVGSDDLLDNL